MIEAGINRVSYENGQVYFLYVPGSVIEGRKAAGVLVSVHGYGARKADRKSLERVKGFAEIWSHLSDEKGWVVLAPHFHHRLFDDNYQRLNLFGKRADIYLHDLLDRTRELLPDIGNDATRLFGFSGGGQFVHRYVAFHPERVLCAVAGAPGWYLWPDPDLPYPLGTAPHSLPKGVTTHLRRFLRSRLRIIVGDRDREQGAFRKSYGEYDLEKLQGIGRKNRAENWLESIREFALQKGYTCRIDMKVVSHAAHKINDKIIRCAETYFRENEDAAQTDRQKGVDQ
jgi:pimeloyl-ACP methyl ester carboxylesterase